MALEIVRYEFCLTDVLQGGVACTNPNITWDPVPGVTINCIKGNCIEVEFIPGSAELAGGFPCVNFIVDCQADCGKCPPAAFTKCFCSVTNDCTTCESCVDNLCESICPAGEFCLNSTCVDCLADTDCPYNQECINSVCQCNPALPFVDVTTNQCVECLENTDCPDCEVCEGGACVPKDCGTYVCQPITEDCVECLNGGHCALPNMQCNPTTFECECVPGFLPDPGGNGCVDICVVNADCGFCEICVDGVCVPASNCPPGEICDGTSGLCIPNPCTTSSPQQVVWTHVPASCTAGFTGAKAPLTGTVNITTQGYIDSDIGEPSYMNHRFSLSVTNGDATTGAWEISEQGTTGFVPTASSSPTTLEAVFLDDPELDGNLVGFMVRYTDVDGRKIVFSLSRSSGSPLLGGNWAWEIVESTGIDGACAGTLVPEHWKLCAEGYGSGATLDPSYISAIQTTGNIAITWDTGDTADCIKTDTVTGCGSYVANIDVYCNGTLVGTEPIPKFTIGSYCCGSITEECVTIGPECSTVSNKTINITAWPKNDMAGTFSAIPKITGIAFKYLYDMDDICWGTASGDATFTKPDNELYSEFTWTVNTCISLGTTCTAMLDVCQSASGSYCLLVCDYFKVNIESQDDIPTVGQHTHTAYPSPAAVATYSWNTGPTTQSIVTNDTPGATYIVTATSTAYGCTAIDVVQPCGPSTITSRDCNPTYTSSQCVSVAGTYEFLPWPSATELPSAESDCGGATSFLVPVLTNSDISEGQFVVPGTYFLEYTFSDSCCNVKVCTVNLVVAEDVVVVTDANICDTCGDLTTIDLGQYVTGGCLPYSIVIDSFSGGTYTQDPGNDFLITVTPTGTGDFTINYTVSDSSPGGSSDSGTLLIEYVCATADPIPVSRNTVLDLTSYINSYHPSGAFNQFFNCAGLPVSNPGTLKMNDPTAIPIPLTQAIGDYYVSYTSPCGVCIDLHINIT